MALIFVTGSTDGLGRALVGGGRQIYLSSGMHTGGRARWEGPGSR